MDALFPIHCPGCGREGVRLCADCLSSIRVLPMSLCPGCGCVSPGGATHGHCGGLTPFSAMLSPYQYADPRVRVLIKEYKYHGAKDIEKILAGLTASGVRSLARFFPESATVVPMPLHASRSRERGFNQAAVIGAVVAQVLGRPVAAPLARVRRTEEQARLSAAERADNCRDAFRAAPVAGDFILVDDVVTSGATMRAAAAALKKAGAREVAGFALAHGQGDRFRS